MPVTEAEFRAAVLPFTLHEEGGLSLDRNDKGNWTGGAVGKGTLAGTKYGIAASAHPTLDIRHLTIAQACDIYWDEYCRRPGFDRLALPMLQVVFDAAVNSGAARSRAWLAAVADRADEGDQIRAFSALRLAHCKRLKTWRRYGAGWEGRIDRCQAHALALAAVHPVALKPRVSAPRVEVPPAAPKASSQPQAGWLGSLLMSVLGAFLPPSPQPTKA